MNTTLLTVGIAVLFGTYDLFIKFAAGKISPPLGAMLTQIVSALTLVCIFIFRFRSAEAKQNSTLEGILFVIAAGVLIALALVLLFFLLQNKDVKAATTLPTILILRNVSLVLLAVFVLREQMSMLKVFGLLLSLTGIYFLGR